MSSHVQFFHFQSKRSFQNFHTCRLHGNHSDMPITSLSEVVLNPYLVWRFVGTIGISHIPGCFGNLVAMATRGKPL